ncbi:hypothetical protein C5C28_10095 [Rathayibacter rathayi]|nr:hypothetical protein C5C28_10095 [Rathayibacter rathayi]
MTAMHKWNSNPTALLQPLDDKIVDVSKITQELLFDNWIYAVVVIAAIGIAVGAFTKKIRPAMVTVGCTIAALGFVSVVSTVPLEVAHAADGVASSVVSTADERALTYAGIPAPGAMADDGSPITTATPDEATGAILNDSILAPFWRQGQTGESDYSVSTDAMFKASTATWAEVGAGYDADAKRDDYNNAVEAIKNDPATSKEYTAIKGQAGGRTGAGFMALIAMTTIGALRIPAEGLQFAGILIMRMVPIIGPLFALLAIVEATRAAATGFLKTIGASVYNVIVFGVVAAVHTAITAILFVNTDNLFTNMLVSFVVTYILLKISKPFRSITKLATGANIAKEFSDSPSAPWDKTKAVLGGTIGVGTSAAGSTIGNTIAERRTEKRAEENGTVAPQAAHPGPEAPQKRADTVEGTNPDGTPTTPGTAIPGMHPGWAEAPPIKSAWSEAPQTSREDANSAPDQAQDAPSWDEPIYVPSPDYVPSADPWRLPDQQTPDIVILNEPELVDGQMVNTIYIPEDEPFTYDPAVTISFDDGSNFIRDDA